MDYRRIVLLALITLTGVALWHAWEQDYPRQQTAAVAIEEHVSTAGESFLGPEVPSAGLAASAVPIAQEVIEDKGSSNIIRIKTDVLNVAVDPSGGNLIEAGLTHYLESSKDDDKKVTLLKPSGEYKFIAQSGLMGEKGMPSFTNNVKYSSELSTNELSGDQNQLIVRLHGKTKMGIDIVKQFTFERGSYLIDVNYQIINNSSKPWEGHLITQLTRRDNPPPSTGFFQMRSFFGASISTSDKPYRKISFKEINKLNERGQRLTQQPSTGGWAAMQQHYFLAAWIPDQKTANDFYYKVYPKQMYAIGTEGSLLTVAPQTHQNVSAKIYIGPELTQQLKAAAPHLEMTIDYGWLWFISVMLFWIMQHIENIIGNWGWSIVIVTVMIKLAFFQLTAKSHRSMARLRDLQPKIMAIKKRNGDDKQKMTQATMELYRTEKVNPFGGCLPILVQIPVFIALYWVLIESVELRQAPFILWIHDLSSKDPFYILPALFCITMMLQQKLTPQAMDPTQAKIMMVLPIVVTVLFLNFPAGLLLYMVVNTIISVLQQWYLSRHMTKIRSKAVKKTINNESGA
jgi:YidC/Oxa1 family membrane protein insertase